MRTGSTSRSSNCSHRKFCVFLRSWASSTLTMKVWIRDLMSCVAVTGLAARYWSNRVSSPVWAQMMSSLVYSLICLVGPPTDGGKLAG